MMLGAGTAAAASSRADSSSCVQLTRDLPANAFPVRSDLAPADCTPARAAFRYDASTGVVRTARALAAGEVVRAPPVALVGDVAAGALLTLQSAVGPVVVERQVVVLRPIRGGGLLVRGADGRVFPAPAPQVRP